MVFWNENIGNVLFSVVLIDQGLFNVGSLLYFGKIPKFAFWPLLGQYQLVEILSSDHEL